MAGSDGRVPLPVPVPPVTPLVVLRAFTPAPAAWMPAHRGVDLQAGDGQPVRAIRSGTVVFAEVLVDRPVLVLRSHGVRFTFEPVRATAPVGTHVHRGDTIGIVATGGHCSARCVHWGARRDGVYLDPMSFLQRGAPVLKPPR